MDIRRFYNMITKAYSYTLEIARLCRAQNYNRAVRLFREYIKCLTEILNEYEKYTDQLNAYGIDIDIRTFSNILTSVSAAQEQKDYVLFADLIMINMESLLGTMISNLQQYIPDESFANDRMDVPTPASYFAKNIEILEKYDSELVRLIVQQAEKIGLYKASSYYDESRSVGYDFEISTSGLPTMRMTDSNGSYYMHSVMSPFIDGRNIAQNYYRYDCSEYIICGIGLGYHIKSILALSDSKAKVIVCESDLNMLAFSMITNDYTALYESGGAIIYDPMLVKFSELLKCAQAKNCELIIHYPSIRNISNEKIRASVEALFVQESSIRNQRGEMALNFEENISGCDGYVDELECDFAGRTVYLVAAGPSLDKNVHLLKDVDRTKSVILCVGRVLKKLINEQGIVPDYTIALDAADRSTGYFNGMWNADANRGVPMIVAATASSRIVRLYEGPKYLVCQNGYPKAEEYAAKHSYMTYETGGSVATIAFDIAARLKATKVVLMGLDLAYTGSKMHATMSGARDMSDDVSGLIPVNGINGDVVYTTKAMEMYIKWFKSAIKKTDIEVIDATEGGALIDGAKVMTLKEVIKIDK